MNWIDEVVKSHEESEAPKKFFYWAAISAISAVIKKNIYLDRFHYKLWPNIYVFIVGRSGIKKGIPITLAKTLVTKANATRIIMGRNSMPRILQDLGHACTLEGGGILKDAQGYLISGELAGFFVKDPDALTVLTDLFNTHEHEDKWINSLKGTGVDRLVSPCLSLLGATNEDLFPDAVSSKDTKGGFIARTFIVYSNEAANINDLVDRPIAVINTDYLAEYLKELTKVKGQFKWTDKAKAAYSPWYKNLMEALQGGDLSDPTGTYGRLGDQVLKLAMLISLGNSFSLELTVNDIYEAIDSAESCCQGMKHVTMGQGKSNLAPQTRMIIKKLIVSKDHSITREKLLRDFWGEMDHFDLDRIAETLLAADVIKIKQEGKKTTYVMKEDKVDLYNTFKKGIQ